MSKKFSISLIAATVAASMAITPAAQAGARGLGLGLGILAVGVMASQAHQAQKAEEARARARAKAQAQAEARAAAAARRQQEIAAEKALAAKQAKEEAAKQDVANTDANADEKTDPSAKPTVSTYVAAPSSTAALTQADVGSSNKPDTPAKSSSIENVAAVETVSKTASDTSAKDAKAADDNAPATCKRYVPALGVAVTVGC